MDIDYLHEEGYSMLALSQAIELAMLGIQHQNSAEAEYLRNYLESLLDEANDK